MSVGPSDAAPYATLRFLGRFVRRPWTVGSIVPSTPQLAAMMVAPLAGASVEGATRDASTLDGTTIVELGPGTGAFTSAIVEHLKPTDHFLAVEVDSVFCGVLHRRWPTMDAVCASAESLPELLRERQWRSVDHIVSGLPFATLPTDTTGRIVEAIGKCLRAGGTFTTFHYAHSFRVPRAAAFRQHMGRVLGSVPSTRFVAWNVPPALAVTWVNRSDSQV